MLEIVKKIEEEIREGRGVTREEALELLKSKAHEELIELAHRLTVEYASKKFDFCAIINARSGCCSEDCKWCAQSAHWGGANSKVYGFIGKCACAREAKAAEANKVRRIAIVTAGRGQSKSEIDEICEAIREMKANTSIGICASLGIVELEDLKLRQMAEFDNFRRRTNKEKLELMTTAGERIFKDMLPLVDDFERAKMAMAKSDDINAVREGIDLIYNKFINFLAANNVKAIDTTDADFNTDLHEAITTFAAGEDKKGKVIDCTQKGYTLGEKVIRFAKVVVGE